MLPGEGLPASPPRMCLIYSCCLATSNNGGGPTEPPPSFALLNIPVKLGCCASSPWQRLAPHLERVLRRAALPESLTPPPVALKSPKYPRIYHQRKFLSQQSKPSDPFDAKYGRGPANLTMQSAKTLVQMLFLIYVVNNCIYERELFICLCSRVPLSRIYFHK